MLTSISAFVLSGGYSRRFGTDKALYQYEGQSLIRYPLELLNEKFPTVSIVAKEAGKYEWLGFPVVPDIIDQQTPLVGVLSGMVNSNTDWNYFQACDMPFLQPGILDLLASRFEELNGETQALLPLTDQGVQPLAGFYRKNTIDSLREAISQDLSVREWVDTLVDVRKVNFGNALSYCNVNTVEDLDAVSA
ncbi:MAG: molybdenum cofactor guanylyltransferase [Candidatus Marinimicrobia bacterium]|nr:molybdenum cofactor guanylyltransferase [Candidatus Neomarinimicrobiota bacterium]MCF7829298.1 molybdenum cofactor guanylyltransferase [Candidatus Neomarinimicrobiota bacterium]MCF7880040.1 molybdenum cofactor guanylyltransferase [Candidatus Neomarinimicrobiota bacterium]